MDGADPGRLGELTRHQDPASSALSGLPLIHGLSWSCSDLWIFPVMAEAVLARPGVNRATDCPADPTANRTNAPASANPANSSFPQLGDGGGDHPAETADSSHSVLFIRDVPCDSAKNACAGSQMGVAAEKQSEISTHVDSSRLSHLTPGTEYEQAGGICRCDICGRL